MSVGLPSAEKPSSTGGMKLAWGIMSAALGAVTLGPAGLLLAVVPFMIPEDGSPPEDPMRSGWAGRKLRKLERALREKEREQQLLSVQQQIREQQPPDRSRMMREALDDLERSRRAIRDWPVDEETKRHAEAAAEMRFRERVLPLM